MSETVPETTLFFTLDHKVSCWFLDTTLFILTRVLTKRCSFLFQEVAEAARDSDPREPVRVDDPAELRAAGDLHRPVRGARGRLLRLRRRQLHRQGHRQHGQYSHV